MRSKDVVLHSDAISDERGISIGYLTFWRSVRRRIACPPSLSVWKLFSWFCSASVLWSICTNLAPRTKRPWRLWGPMVWNCPMIGSGLSPCHAVRVHCYSDSRIRYQPQAMGWKSTFLLKGSEGRCTVENTTRFHGNLGICPYWTFGQENSIIP